MKTLGYMLPVLWFTALSFPSLAQENLQFTGNLLAPPPVLLAIRVAV